MGHKAIEETKEGWRGGSAVRSTAALSVDIGSIPSTHLVVHQRM